MKKLSKFEYDIFYSGSDRHFAVNRQKYTEEEARAIFEQQTECKEEFFEILEGAVTHRAGVDFDGERHVGWWLDFCHDGTEPRYCPVWAFQY